MCQPICNILPLAYAIENSGLTKKCSNLSREHTNWDVKLALEFKDLQQRIVSSIVTSCNAGRKLVEYELGKCMAWHR